jgi:PKD repeat protein
MERSNRVVVCALLATAAMTLAACSLDKQEMPPLSGPSEFALALSMTASPDQLPRDASSQAVVTITARNVAGQPIAGQRIAVSLGTNAPQGATLSQSEVVTGSNGQATVVVTAPVPNSLGNISVIAIPVGTNSGNASARVISIAALPLNSAGPVITDFTISNSTPDINETVTFDASCQPATTCATSGVTDEGLPCNTCSFTWSFGDGGTATGQIARHAFAAAGAHQVMLTATDVGGVSSSLTKTVTATATSIPTTVSISISPSPPVAKQLSTFTASATAATNHRITSYQFIFGDGNSVTQPTPVVQYAYSQAGTFPFVLTVRDDLGQSATINQVVTVNSGLTATFTYTVSGQTVNFDASGSSSSVASTITDYAWDFNNDGSYDTNGSSATTSHDFGASGTYTVKLKITDNRGVTQTTSQNVVVP